MRCDESDGSQLEQQDAAPRWRCTAPHCTHSHTAHMATQTQTIGNDKQRELEDLKNEIKKKKPAARPHFDVYSIVYYNAQSQSRRRRHPHGCWASVEGNESAAEEAFK